MSHTGIQRKESDGMSWRYHYLHNIGGVNLAFWLVQTRLVTRQYKCTNDVISTYMDCQLSQFIWESPRYRVNLPVSHTSDQISWLKVNWISSPQKLKFETTYFMVMYWSSGLHFHAQATGNSNVDTLSANAQGQPCCQGLSSYRSLEQTRRDPGTRW